jgi:hypothetical protein
MENRLTLLAKELSSRLPARQGMLTSLEVRVWADEDEGYIYCAPKARSFGYGSILYVKEIVLFAEYHDLDVSTEEFETGAGLKLS